MKKWLCGFLCILLFVSIVDFGYAEGSGSNMEREVLNLNSNWLYSPMDYTNAKLKYFDDSNFEAVCVPHANKVIERHKGDSLSFNKEIASYRFVSWYRRHFTLDEAYEGKRIFVEFEAVANVCEVYVNGKWVGEHKGAYTPFTLDITDLVSLGEDNVIAVRVDSTRRSDVPPEGGSVDYCLFGGIVRNVNMIITNDIYIEDVFVTTDEVSEESALVRVSVTTNAVDKYTMTVTDADGNVVASGVDSAVVKNPNLWSVDNPYLYTITVELESGDVYETKIGIRSVKFTDSGVLLNGENIKIMGINRHEQWPWQGRAIPDKLQARDADMIKETGFNAVRCSHYPQAKSFLNRCDEIGLLVFEEAPGWQHIGDDAWQDLYIENIREMILRDRNHPSVISWGVRVNESNDNNTLYEKTNALARELDPTRPTHGARREDTYSHSKYYEDIYTAHYIYPENPRYTPFLVTEHSWDCWTNGYGLPGATDEQALAFTKDFADKVNYYYGNDKCAGGFAWSMFDYNNEVNYTRTNNVFYSGLYDIFRLPKMASNLYTSQKDPEKCGANIYIANYWDDDSKPLTVKEVSGDIAQGNNSGGGVTVGDEFSVTVMSNCDKVELYINAKKSDITPVRQYTNLPHPFFVFKGVKYEAGEVTAVGYIDGEEVARYTQRTPGKAARLIMEPDYKTLKADGTDMTQVTVTMVDENGTRLPLCENEVTIAVSGAGEFIGEETIKLEGGRCAFLVKSRYLEEGVVNCTVTSEGVEGASCSIDVEEYEDNDSVPVSEGKSLIEPVVVREYNDTDSIFEYSSDWIYINQSRCNDFDNHYSDKTGASVNLTFEGAGIEWYGTTAPNHGIMGVTLDEGEEVFIDCYSDKRSDNVIIYSSGELDYGVHTLRVRVTGEKNSASTGKYVNADLVKVYGAPKMKCSKGDRIAFDGWSTDNPSWMITNGVYKQTKTTGDSLALCNERMGNGAIVCRVSVSGKDGGGTGIVARAQDRDNFYLFEIKIVNNTPTWAIWLNRNNKWTSLAGGPCKGLSGDVYLKMEMNKSTLSAFMSKDGNIWTPLGACNNFMYTDGYVGVRTHSTSGEFFNFTLMSVTDFKYEISYAEITDGSLKRVGIVNNQVYVGEAEKMIIAQYEGDTLIDAKQIMITDFTEDVNLHVIGDRCSIYIWDEVTPLSEVYEITI